MASNTFKIAAIPGDGIGKEVMPEGVRVLDAAAKRFKLQLESLGCRVEHAHPFGHHLLADAVAGNHRNVEGRWHRVLLAAAQTVMPAMLLHAPDDRRPRS